MVVKRLAFMLSRIYAFGETLIELIEQPWVSIEHDYLSCIHFSDMCLFEFDSLNLTYG